MFAILHALGMFVADQFKSRCRLQAENLFLRHQLNVACGTRAEAWSGVGCGAMHDGQSQNTRPGEETSSTIKNLRVKTQSTEMPTVTPLA